MRFFANGPNIPEALVEKREQGNVVFVCGAGVSIPAGLPDFSTLAKQVIDELGTPASDPAYVLLKRAVEEGDPDFAPPTDQVFSLLQRDYGTEIVESIVDKKLRTPRNADLTYHKAILKLSANSTGKTQLVAHGNISGPAAPSLDGLLGGFCHTCSGLLPVISNVRIAPGHHELTGPIGVSTKP